MSYLRKTWAERDSGLWLALIRIMTGWVFLHSGWGKLTDPGFLGGMGKTLGHFAGQNPYPWMASLLQTVAIPNAGFFGVLFSWGEFLVGLSLFFGVLTEVGLLGSLAMSLTFYFAAGWTGASTASLSLFLAVASLAMLPAFAGKVLSVDQLLQAHFPGLYFWRPRQGAQPA